MRKIKNQLDSSRIQEIFDTCNTFINEPMKSIIFKNKNIILQESKNYNLYVPKMLDKYPLTNFAKAEIDEIKKLYTYKFSPKNSEGRIYYDLLLSNAGLSCPICGCATANTLDHFIPKTKYPQLCITPNNLIPVCSNCNEKKQIKYSNNYLEVPFHPYFEEMNEKWLECKIVFDVSKIYKYIFYCGNLTSKLVDKYKVHLDIYKLNDTFQGYCNSEIVSSNDRHRRLLDISKEELIAFIKETAKDNEKVDCNGWKAALYRGLERQIDDYCIYLKNRYN
ncbi:MAG: hypothetical protein IKP77_02515 [Acholeplasmatales bacterium]|nr:hypothetical protein [Acholeplasmatales bacterium]